MDSDREATTALKVLSYLALAIAPFFVSVTCSKRLRNYSISESGGVPISDAFVNKEYFLWIMQMIQLWHLLFMKAFLHRHRAHEFWCRPKWNLF